MSEPTAEHSGVNRKRVWLLVLGVAVLVVGVGGFGALRYTMFRLESRDMRQQGIDLFHAERFDEAIDVIQSYHLRRPKDRSILLWLGRSYLSKQPATREDGLEALSAIDTFLSQNPDDRPAKLYRLQALLTSRADEQALAYAKQLHNEMPSQPLPLIVTLQGLSRSGDHAEAVRVASQALATPLPRPGFRDAAHEALVRSHVAMNQTEEAARWARESLSGDPTSLAHFERWVRVSTPIAEPQSWLDHVEGLSDAPQNQRDTLRLIALDNASQRARRLNRPSQAEAYRSELEALLTAMTERPALEASQAQVVASLLRSRGQFDRQLDFLQRQAGATDAGDAVKLLLAREAFYVGRWSVVTETAARVSTDATPDWLHVYRALAAQQQGDESVNDLSEITPEARPVWQAVLSETPPDAAWLGALRSAWPTLNEPVLLRTMARGFAAHGNPAAAAGAYERAIVAAPAWATLKVEQAEALLELGRQTRAAERLDDLDATGVRSAGLPELRLRVQLARWDEIEDETRKGLLDQIEANSRIDPLLRLRVRLLAGADTTPRTAEAWSTALRSVVSEARSDTAWSGLIEALPEKGAVVDSFAEALLAEPDAPANLLASWGKWLSARGRSDQAWSIMTSRFGGPGSNSIDADALVGRLVIADALNEPGVWAWAQRGMSDVGVDALLAALPRWPKAWREMELLRRATREQATPAGVWFATGLDFDEARDRILTADTFEQAREHSGTLQTMVASSAGHAREDALILLDRFNLALGDYAAALEARTQWHRHRPDDPRRMAALGRLFRVVGEHDAADAITGFLRSAAQRRVASPTPSRSANLFAALAALGEDEAAGSVAAALGGTGAAVEGNRALLSWRIGTGQTEAARALAGELWSSPLEANRRAVQSFLPLLELDETTRGAWVAALNGVELDPSSRRLWTAVLLNHRRGDEAKEWLAAASPSFSPTEEGSEHSGLYWLTLLHASRDANTDAVDETLDAASRNTRSGPWFAQLAAHSTAGMLRDLLSDPAYMPAAIEALGQSADTATVLTFLHQMQTAAPGDSVPRPSALRDRLWRYPQTQLRELYRKNQADDSAAATAVLLDRLGLMMVADRLPEPTTQQVLTLCVQARDLVRANHYASLLAATAADRDPALSLAVASLRSAVGANDGAVGLAEGLVGRSVSGLRNPAYAAEVAAVFVRGGRYEQARDLIWPRLDDGTAWREAAIRLLPLLVANPAELTAWVQRLGGTLPLDHPNGWPRVAAAVHESLSLSGDQQPVAAAKRWLDDQLLRARSNNGRPAEVPLAAESAAGMLAQLLGDYPAMTAHYDRLVAAQPDNPVVLNNFADGLASMKDQLDRALELANRAVELAPQIPNIHDTLARIHQARGEHDDAIRHARRAAELAPDAFTWQINLVDKLLSADQLETAALTLTEIDERIDDDESGDFALNATDRRELERLRRALALASPDDDEPEDTNAIADLARQRAAERAAREAEIAEEARRRAEQRRQREAALRAQYEAEQAEPPDQTQE